MKCSFHQPDLISMVAESDAEQDMLARVIELRGRAVWRPGSWQFSGGPTFPEKKVSRIDLRMSDDHAPIKNG